MAARISSLIGCVLLMCILPAALAIKFYKFGMCVHSSPCSSIPTNGLMDDWALIVATAPAADNVLTYWGPTFIGCDTNSIQESCCNQGIYYQAGDDNTNSKGFSYGYNAKLDKWTIEKFFTTRQTVPGTNMTAYETFYNTYITVETGLIFKDGKCNVAPGVELTVSPMLRKTRWILLDTDQNESYRIVMSCENVDGFLYNGYPQIQIYVKRSKLDSFSNRDNIKNLVIYEAIMKALAKQRLNPDNIKWQIITQSLPSPTDAVFNTINWDLCSCKISGNALANVTDSSQYY